MQILFDQGTPVPPRRAFASHAVSTVYEVGWSSLSNGELLGQAEGKFHVLVTTDKRLRYQQNLANRQLAIFVLPTTSWPLLAPHAQQIADDILTMVSGEYREFSQPE
jgi:hypothetical protein